MPTEVHRVKLKINDPRDDRLIPGIQGKIVATQTDDIDQSYFKYNVIFEVGENNQYNCGIG